MFIIVCKNTRIAKVVYEWLAEDKAQLDIPPAKIEGFRNRDGHVYTIRVDSKVVHETDTGEAKSDESRWMRFILDTVGKTGWTLDRQGRPIYPEGFEELAQKLGRPLHPPGRDVRCIVSVGMLTEGWDCTTVTHIIGIRPFMSQLLCEQVVGRGLRRASYELGPDGKFTEEVSQVFGVPFEVIPFKANPQGPAKRREKRYHVHALPGKTQFEISFPRVEGYTQAIRNRITVDWASVPPLVLVPGRIPPEVEMKGLSVNNAGKQSLSGPGAISEATLAEFRAKRRVQELIFDLGRTLIKSYVAQPKCEAPAHVLFPQIVNILQRYVAEKVHVHPPADIKDLFLAPYYGWLVEILAEAITAGHFPRRGSGGAAIRSKPRPGLNRGSRFLDKPRAARGFELPRELRRSRHPEVGTVSRILYRQACGHRRHGQKRRPWLRHSLPAQWADARLYAGLHYPSENRAADSSDSGNQRVRSTGRRQTRRR